MANHNLWQIDLDLKKDHIDIFMDELEQFADSMTCSELNEKTEDWCLTIFTQTLPDENAFQRELNRISNDLNIKTAEFKISEVADIDWVTESQKNFESVEAGDVFIHPSWKRNEVPRNKITIEIDPERAFGTGGHETTKGCIIAMQENITQVNIHNVLDMGCGTGLLGIAAVKIWDNAKAALVDNDPECITTSFKNADINNVAKNCYIGLSDGYKSDLVINNAEYDLIISNILATPLIEFAPDAYKYLTNNGYIILAGLRISQSDDVIQSHENVGFKLLNTKHYGDWAIITMQK